jgi:molybdopterin converting factor subunit 1
VEIRLLFFASCRDIAGTREMSLQLLDGSTVMDLRQVLSDRFPALRPLEGVVSIAVNAEYADNAVVLGAGDEVAVIPPVSGGGR